MKRLFLLLPILFIVLACGPVVAQSQPTPDINQIVSATLTAIAQRNETTVPTTDDATGSISGVLTYPAETFPALRVVAMKTDYSQTYYVDPPVGQLNYQIDNLPPGSYTVIAYAFEKDGAPSNYGGGYTSAVMCGLTPECTDHALIPVTVTAGQVAQGINPQDWMMPDGTYPQNLGANPFPHGNISGTLTFPASTLPAMRIMFYNQTDKSPTNYVETQAGQSSFLIALHEGTYTVVAYSLGGDGFAYGIAGGYTKAVLCGLTANCTDHSLIPITVKDGDAITINQWDWYAPEGSFPPMPTP